MIKKQVTYHKHAYNRLNITGIAGVMLSFLFFLTSCSAKQDHRAALKQVDSLQQCIKFTIKEVNTIDLTQVKAGIDQINQHLSQLDSLVGDTIRDEVLAKLLLEYSSFTKPLQVYADTVIYLQRQLQQADKQLNNLKNDFSKKIISDTLAVKALVRETENVNTLTSATNTLIKMVVERMDKLNSSKTRIQQTIQVLSKPTKIAKREKNKLVNP